MAGVVKNSPSSPYQNPAIGYLGGIGDKSDIATLLNTARTNTRKALIAKLGWKPWVQRAAMMLFPC